MSAVDQHVTDPGLPVARGGYAAPMRALSIPLSLARSAGRIKDVATGGRPKGVRLVEVGHPEGLIFQSSRVVVDVIGGDGRVTRFEPELPVPFPYAWGYRLARRLGVPLVSDVEPSDLGFQVGRS